MFFNKQDKNAFAAIQDNGECITYNQLKEASQSMSGQIPKRSLVFSLCENSIGSLVGYTSFLDNQIVPLLLDSGLDQELLAHLIEVYQPGYLWVSDQKKADLLKQHPEYHQTLEAYNYTLLKTTYEPSPLYEDLALLLTTSGSTGSPKLVRQSYKNIQSNAEAIVEYLEITDRERPITTLPMNYTYGLSIINSHLYKGATILLSNKGLMQKEFWTFFKKEEATSFGGVPYTYEMLKRLRFFRMDLPSLKTMTQAGGKLSPELHKEFAQYAQEHQKRFYVMYGQTEATARMSYLPYKDSLRKYGSMGIAIPGGKFSLIDVDEKEITEPEITGELVYQGPNVTLGYAEEREDLAKGDENNGILTTGDMAKRDKDGYYYIVGRKKRFIKIFGNRVNLDETERMLKTAFEDMECACSGVDDKMKIYITDETKKEIVKKYVSEKTGIHFSAFDVKHISEIPKNEAGKTLYIKLEETVNALID
ncbi:AMP-binding protein [Acetobacterium fimetarium]|uniref:AMP-binding protein n=1 Tax=Acetobacterium fimetarium TaxID=52691 RepID=A0ABR6WW19_9FIRM|nr:AMP-binding protein [Acetobacterium fimetarium]MBC3804834.1 AMP-binding protein [Acetobacterium fimetarium]